MRVPVNIDNSPLIKILPIVILGILIGDWIELAWWIAGISAAVCALCLVAFRGSALIRTLYGALTIFCTALTISEINSLSTIAPHHQPIEAVVEIIDNSAMTSGGYNRTTARIVAVDDGDNQSVVREKIYLISPTELELGKVYKVTMTIGDIGGEGYDGYARVMRRRGYTGSAFVAEDSVQEIENHRVSPLRTLGPRMQRVAKERLERLALPPSAMALSEAMTLGIRDGLSEEIKADYSRSGAYHLLAVSGLHIGIIALLINTLLLPLPLIRGGHRVRNIIAIALIWLYTLLTGAAPSAVRSAVMFSGAQGVDESQPDKYPLRYGSHYAARKPQQPLRSQFPALVSGSDGHCTLLQPTIPPRQEQHKDYQHLVATYGSGHSSHNSHRTHHLTRLRADTLGRCAHQPLCGDNGLCLCSDIGAMDCATVGIYRRRDKVGDYHDSPPAR